MRASLEIQGRISCHAEPLLWISRDVSLAMQSPCFGSQETYLLPCRAPALDLKRRISCHAEPLLWIPRDVSLAMQSTPSGAQETQLMPCRASPLDHRRLGPGLRRLPLSQAS